MQKVGKDDEEELLDSSTAAAALAPESNVEHIKQVKEKLDTGVLDGAADESDRILGKKNKGKKKMFRKNGNGNGAIPNPWKKDGSGSGSGSSSDTAMDLEEAKARIAELEAAQAEYDELQEQRITFLKIALDECEGDNGDGTGVLNAVGQCNPGGIVGAFNRDRCRGYTCLPGTNGSRDCFNSEYAICVTSL